MKINYTTIFKRMLRAGGLKNSSALARVLGVSPQGISNYKKQGKMPLKLVIRFSEIYDISLDWLLSDENSIQDKPYKVGAEQVSTNGKPVSVKTSDVDTEITASNQYEVEQVKKLLHALRSSNQATVNIVIMALQLAADGDS